MRNDFIHFHYKIPCYKMDRSFLYTYTKRSTKVIFILSNNIQGIKLLILGSKLSSLTLLLW